MRRGLAALSAAACLIGCDAEGGARRGVDAAATPRAAVDDVIVGRWVVTGLDDETPAPGAVPIKVAIDADSIRARSQCVRFPYIYKRDGARILLGKINPGGMCARGLSHWEREFDIGLYNADRARRTTDGGLEFSGTGGVVRMQADATD